MFKVIDRSWIYCRHGVLCVFGEKRLYVFKVVNLCKAAWWICVIPETELALSNSKRESLITRFTNECLALQASQIIDNEDAPFSLSKLYQHCKQQNHEVTVGTSSQHRTRSASKRAKSTSKTKKTISNSNGGIALNTLFHHFMRIYTVTHTSLCMGTEYRTMDTTFHTACSLEQC